MLTEQQLLKWKKEIDTAKTLVSELTGQLNALQKQLQEDFQCKTVSEAETLVEKMQGDIDEMTELIEQQMKSLESKYFSE